MHPEDFPTPEEMDLLTLRAQRAHARGKPNKAFVGLFEQYLLTDVTVPWEIPLEKGSTLATVISSLMRIEAGRANKTLDVEDWRFITTMAGGFMQGMLAASWLTQHGAFLSTFEAPEIKPWHNEEASER